MDKENFKVICGGVDLSNITHMFVDFDNTACIHRARSYANGEEFFLKCLAEQGKLYSSSKPNYALQFVMDAYRNINYYGITVATFNLSMHIKEQYLKDNFFGLFKELYSCPKAGTKVQLIDWLIHSWGVKPDKVLLIDDEYSNFEGARELGIQYITVQELMNWYAGYLMVLS